MPVTAFRGMTPLARLFFSAFIVLAVFFVFQLAAAVMAIPLFGFTRVAALLTTVDMTDPVSVDMLKFFQVFQTLGLFIAPSFLIAWLLEGNITEYLQLRKKIPFIPAVLVILLIFTINPLINFLAGLNAEIHFPEWLSGMEKWMRSAEEAAGELTEAFLKVDSVGGLFFNLFMVAVLPALGEELLFRGVIQKILTDLTKCSHIGIWLSAALFSALHFQFFGFFPRMILGALFGYLFVWSGSLWLPILAHFVNNAGAVIALFLVDKNIISETVEEFGTGIGHWVYAVPSLAVGIVIIGIVRSYYTGRTRA